MREKDNKRKKLSSVVEGFRVKRWGTGKKVYWTNRVKNPQGKRNQRKEERKAILLRQVKGIQARRDQWKGRGQRGREKKQARHKRAVANRMNSIRRKGRRSLEGATLGKRVLHWDKNDRPLRGRRIKRRRRRARGVQRAEGFEMSKSSRKVAGREAREARVG
jgi:hypothetical protein